MTAPLRALCCLSLVLAACASAPPQRFYTLSAASSPAAPGLAGTASSIVISPVTLPGTLDRPQLVARVAPNRVQLLDQDRWAEPLKDQIARVVAANLARELPGVRVQTSRDGGARNGSSQPLRLLIDMQQLEFTPGEAVVLEARWTARPAPDAAADAHKEAGAAADAAREGRVQLREPVHGAGLDAAVAAHDRILARMSAEMAAALRPMRHFAR